MSDDYSPGDRRQPYSDRGGPEGRHAETHDVRREELTNSVGPQLEDASFPEQLAPVETRPGGGHAAESTPAVDDKGRYDRARELSNDELSRLQVLEPGTRLEQGGTLISIAFVKVRSRTWVDTKRRNVTAPSPSGIPIMSIGTDSRAKMAIRKSSARAEAEGHQTNAPFTERI
jgi:hypothetical protein